MEDDEKPLDVVIGENVRQAREALGLSQAEVARHVGHGFQQQTIVKVEKGERPLRLAEAIRVADVLAITVADLYRSHAALTQAIGIFHSLRMLYDQLVPALRQVEDWRLELANIVDELDRQGLEISQSLRDGLRRYSADDLLDDAVKHARSSPLLRSRRGQDG